MANTLKLILALGMIASCSNGGSNSNNANSDGGNRPDAGELTGGGVLAGHWYGQLGPYTHGMSITDLTLSADHTVEMLTGTVMETSYQRLGIFYSYEGRYSVSGDKILFSGLTAHKLETTDVSSGSAGFDLELRKVKTEGTRYSPPDREYRFVIAIRNGQRTVVFRPADGVTEPKDLFGLSAPADKADDQLEFDSTDILKKMDDVIGNVVIVNSHLSTDQTWTADKIYKLCPTADRGDIIDLSATLTIEPGTVVHAVAGAGLQVLSGGKLIANGTSEKPILIALNADPAENATAARSEWRGILMQDSAGTAEVSLSHCELGGAMTAVYADGGKLLLDHCVLRDNEVGLVVLHESAASATVQSNTFHGNRVPVAIGSNVSFEGTNVVHPEGGRPNHYDGIYVIASRYIDTSVTWSNTEVPYVICENTYLGPPISPEYPYPADALAKIDTTSSIGDVATSLTVDIGGSLTLAAGVALKFRTDTCDGCASSSYLQLEEPAALKDWENATFTIYYDDETKGDTDRVQLPQPLDPTRGYWTGIYWYGPEYDPVYLSSPKIKYAEHH